MFSTYTLHMHWMQFQMFYFLTTSDCNIACLHAALLLCARTFYYVIRFVLVLDRMRMRKYCLWKLENK